MDRFAALTGRHYHLFDYDGPADAERVLVLMGSGAETARTTAAALRQLGEKVGVLQVRLYRPWAAAAFLAALPDSVTAVAVLEQTQGAGRDRGAAVSRRGHHPGAGRRRWHAPHADRDRRALRPVVEGFHPGDGEGGVRRTDAAASRATASPSASTTT